MVLILKKRRVCPMRVISLSASSQSIKYKAELSLKESQDKADISKVFHCDGLLLCTIRESKLVVCNPCLGKTKWIQHYTARYWNTKCALGYVDNKSCRSYKILSYSFKPNNRVDEFGIYEFSSDTWRDLDVDTDDFVMVLEHAVSLKGNVYWCVKDKTDKFDSVLCFDFRSERLRRLCFPNFQTRGFNHLSVTREEQLSVLHRCYAPLQMELWVTNEIDTEAELSWSLPWSLSYLIDEEKKVFVCCIQFNGHSTKNTLYIFGKDGKRISKMTFGESTYYNQWWPHIFNYVPSFVQIQQ
ncbi:unnamed protein product [Microthlaspi erraticum]|uniref:F-box associated beta-propeller type 1 domain-containing protein n=1 Tax=Microthlaspi erraticum TaxID=1685480 RepID=A0A6D2HI02_9BRAS|nr:unnamed protein product [Microthlaspi erraticum]